jgi:hypothetical protein
MPPSNYLFQDLKNMNDRVNTTPTRAKIARRLFPTDDENPSKKQKINNNDSDVPDSTMGECNSNLSS